jgi:DNA-binding NarL/FixJ family response regulator
MGESMPNAKIAIVEDERVVAADLEDKLLALGYNACGIAYSAKHALSMVEREYPDLVLMDIKLEGSMDGIEVANLIKDRFKVPVIYLTAFSDEHTLQRARVSEPFGYLLKPIQLRDLRSNIEMALFKAGMEKKLRKANAQLEKTIKQMKKEIDDRKRAQDLLRNAHQMLEIEVDKRTAELVKTNEQLKIEIKERKETEKALKKNEKELGNKARELEEINTALNVLLRCREKDKKELEEKVLSNVKELIFPYVKKLQKSRLNGNQATYLSIVESNLHNIIAPFLYRLSSKYFCLTPSEMQVAELVKEGKRTKEIAELLNSSIRAIEFHRSNLRKKLGLANKKANLRSHLLSLI